jgi:hypothetical protein
MNCCPRDNILPLTSFGEGGGLICSSLTVEKVQYFRSVSLGADDAALGNTFGGHVWRLFGMPDLTRSIPAFVHTKFFVDRFVVDPA